MQVVATTYIFLFHLLHTSRALAFPTSYPPAATSQPLPPDEELLTLTYYQPINTNPAPTLSLYSPPQSYGNYPPSSPPELPQYGPLPTSIPASTPIPTYSDCSTTTDLDAYTSSVPTSTSPPNLNTNPHPSSTLTLTSPLLILPGTASPSPSSQPAKLCNKCCPQPLSPDIHHRPDDWLHTLGKRLAGELEAPVQGAVSKLEAQCGYLGGHKGDGTRIVGCSVFGGGVVCGWAWEGGGVGGWNETEDAKGWEEKRAMLV
ncbi:hypothetical protein BKA61DRAFT_650500 [Leptodontidium sp. MPI-SDFR-AT-0119]|nr:hypothetical protein BKA61DRAFT_650500 [Leptodontidium sp. MPI-SDFR-AT-0119]